MKTILFLFIGAQLMMTSLSAQVEITPNSGEFDEFHPWWDGYLGITQKAAYPVGLKARTFEFYNKSGELKWKTEVDPFNHLFHLVLNEKSQYAYLVNLVFDKTALLEKTSKNEFLKLFMVNTNGDLTTHSFKFEGDFECLKDGEFALEISYMCAFDNGIAIITTDPKNDGECYLFTISNSFDVKKVKLGFNWNEQDWIDNKISKLNFLLNSNNLSIIQVSSVDKKYGFEVHTYSLNDLSVIKQGDNTFNLEEIGPDIIGYNTRYHKALSTFDKNLVTYFQIRNGGDATAYYPKLGALFDYQFWNNQLYVVANLYESESEIKMFRPKGLCYFQINSENESDIKNPEIIVFPKSSKKDKIYECSILLGPDVLCFMDYRKKTGCRGLVNGETFLLPKKSTFSRGLALMLNLTEGDEFPKYIRELRMLESAYVIIGGDDHINVVSGFRKILVKTTPFE